VTAEIRSASRPNVWSMTSGVSVAEAARMAGLLEERARFPDQIQVNGRLRDALALAPGERWLEVGSGSGVLCRLAVPCVTPAGCVVGLDKSPELVAAAYRLAAGSDSTRDLVFHVGDGAALPYTDASFDGAFAARLMLHVANPDAVVVEMVRVVRSSGRVVLMDWDFGTVAVDHPDRDLTRRLLEWRTHRHGGDNWSGRQLAARLVAAGLHQVAVTPVVTVARDENASLTQSLWRAAQAARDAGAITSAEHDAWVGALRQRLAAGRFFASIVYFIVCGTRL
jgi:ubiquinone/menaquinone biosynthesis C-methylase UbiE